MSVLGSTAEEALLTNVVEVVGLTYGRCGAGKHGMFALGLELACLTQSVEHGD